MYSLKQFNTDLIVAAAVQCIKVINSDADLPSTLPPGMSARFRMGASLANYVQVLREREREADRQTDRQTERERDRQTDRQTERETETQRETDRERERERRGGERERERARERSLKLKLKHLDIKNGVSFVSELVYIHV